MVQTWDNDPGTYQHTIQQAAIAGFEFLNPISPSIIDFGNVAVGSTSIEQFTITNYWDSELTGMIYSFPGFETSDSFSVPAFNSQNVEVSFSPTELSDYYGDIIISTNSLTFPVVYITVSGSGTATDVTDELVMSNSMITSNYPNPFNPTTSIDFYVRNDTQVTITIFNAKGQKVKTLIDEFKQAGNYSAVWNGEDEMGTSVSSGLYFANMNTAEDSNGKYTSTKKMLLLK